MAQARRVLCTKTLRLEKAWVIQTTERLVYTDISDILENDDKELKEKYKHPLVRSAGELAKKIGGHGGMDFMMDLRWSYCLKNGLPMDADVYDAATWSSIVGLSELSVDKSSSPIEVPDFTRGRWKSAKPLGIVDVN